MQSEKLPPRILFNYSGVGPWLSDCLAGRSLKFSSRVDFNDPFDSQPIYQVDPSHAGRKFVSDLVKRDGSLSPATRVKETQRLHRSLSNPKPVASAENNRMILDSIGILCLTEEWDEPLFWGHYAQKHQGLCIGYRTDRDVFRSAHQVVYDTVRPIIRRPQDTKDEMYRKTFLTKSDAWKSEKEWRVLKLSHSEADRQRTLVAHGYMDDKDAILLADQRGPAIYNFDPTAIESVTMGMNVNQRDKDYIHKCVRSASTPIALYAAEQDKLHYKITRKLVRP